MANLKSSKKSIRKIAKLTARNKAEKSRIKTASKKLQALRLDSGDAEAIKTAAKELMSLTDKAGKHGVWHKNKVNRIKSRLTPLIAQAVVKPSETVAEAVSSAADSAEAVETKKVVRKSATQRAAAKKKATAKKTVAKKVASNSKKTTATKTKKSSSKK